MEWFIISVVSVILLIYAFFKWKLSYWQRRGVPVLQPSIPYGNFKNIGKSRHMIDLLGDVYFTFKNRSPLVGIYLSFSPIAVPTDLDLIRNILIKDFGSFHDRWFYFNEKEDPLSAHMFALHGSKWKNIRSKLTPTFTSGKMKFMYPTVVDVSNRLVDAMSDKIKLGAEVEVKDILARFTTDVIGEIAFGIDCNTLRDASAEFRKYGRVALGVPRHSRMVVNVLKQFPKLAAKFRCKIIRDDVTKFFFRIVSETIAYREKNHVRRNDFMDLLIEMKNSAQDEEKLTVEQIAAQVFLFFIAGFETSSTALSYTLYELALNEDIQRKAREEVFSVLEKHDGVLTYQALKEMQYIDQIISETLRKYPPMMSITRQATEDYNVPGTNITIEKGSTVFLPVYNIHHDPEIYPNPENYDPSRFDPEEKASRHPMSFLAFGEGPRNCIGLRFARMENRIALVDLVKNFKFTTTSKTTIPLKFNNASSLLQTDHDIYLNVQKL